MVLRGGQMKSTQMILIPENRSAAKLISQQVLARIKPTEVEASAAFIDPLLDMTASGKTVTIDDSDEVGSFGGADLAVAVVVPIVVEVIGKLLVKLGETKIEDIRKRRKAKELDEEARAFITIAVDDIEVIVKRINPSMGRREIKNLAQAINQALLEYYMQS
jgi:hypothetical protein